MRITIKNLQDIKIPIARKRIKSAVRKIIRPYATDKRVQISICFVNNRQIKKLNQKYLKKRSATDVLCFDISDTKNELFADIFISVQMARQNALRFATSLSQEIRLYLIHGLLHLLGYNDKSTAGRNRMRKKEQQLLETL